MLRWHGRSATPAAAAVAAGAKTAAAGAVAAAGAMAASGAVAVSGLVAVAALAPRALAQPSFRSQSPQPPKASERREVSFTLFFRGPAARFDVNSLQQCNILSDGLVALQSRGQSQSLHTRRAACLHLPVFTRAWPLPPPPPFAPPPIQLFVKLQAGKVVPLTVQLADTLSSVKVKVQEAEGLPCHDKDAARLLHSAAHLACRCMRTSQCTFSAPSSKCARLRRAFHFPFFRPPLFFSSLLTLRQVVLAALPLSVLPSVTFIFEKEKRKRRNNYSV